jgi:transposase InsO family protein
MTITMDDTQITTLEQVQAVLESPEGLAFNRAGREELYGWIDSVLKRFDYFRLRRKAKGQVKAYLQRLSGLSRAQMTRLVTRDQLEGEIKPGYARRNRFATTYTDFDKDLLAQTDNAHGRLSGPATRKILQRQYTVYGDKRFERLGRISSAHIYNLRSSRVYRERAQTVAKTQSVYVSIGIRRKPEPQGRPGYIRVDTVHQGDLNGEKGVYHINMVDAVLQWEIVLCVEAISEAYLLPVLEIALAMFPFLIVSFHSDNGSEYINDKVAGLLNKLLIEQTKSRSNRTNDNALVEGKNGSVIRKHMGHWHIEQRHAPVINRFYQEHFNPYLNFHRPCGFATVTVDEKGRRRKKYKTYQTPYERLKSLEDAETYLRPGVTIKSLDAIAARQTDNEAAAQMQTARNRLFKKFDSERLHDNGKRINNSRVSTAAHGRATP